MFFNPGNVRFQRGIFVTSVLTCSVVGVSVIFGNFGSQEHVFSPLQRALFPRIDSFFGITNDEVRMTPKPIENNDPRQR